MKRKSVVEQLAGRGRIFREGEAAPTVENVDYEITIWQEWIDVSSHSGRGEVEGLRIIEGSVSSAPFGLIGESIELELEDGRRWACFIQSSNGHLVNRSGFRQD